jgi:hypothetical protein
MVLISGITKEVYDHLVLRSHNQKTRWVWLCRGKCRVEFLPLQAYLFAGDDT